MKILQLSEVREAYFLQAFGRNTKQMRVFSFGRCNYQCPYCKRDGHFRNADGSIIDTSDVGLEEVFRIIDGAVMRGQHVRLSGVDSCCLRQL